MRLRGIFRAAALAGLGLLAAGCLVIEEKAVDVAALNGFFPLEEGAEYTYCSDPADGARECLQVRAGRSEMNGAGWARLRPLDAQDADSSDEDLFLLFFRDEALGDLAFLRIDDDEPMLMLTRAEALPGGVRLTIPECSAGSGEALSAAAVSAGAEVDQHECLFPTQEGLFAAAKTFLGRADVPLFGTITIER